MTRSKSGSTRRTKALMRRLEKAALDAACLFPQRSYVPVRGLYPHERAVAAEALRFALHCAATDASYDGMREMLRDALRELGKGETRCR